LIVLLLDFPGTASSDEGPLSGEAFELMSLSVLEQDT
jgi:hypothetical protein